MLSSILPLLLAAPQLTAPGNLPPLPELAPMEVLWSEYGGSGASGSSFHSGGTSLPAMGFVQLTVQGDRSHVGVWVDFVGELWIDPRFFTDERVPPAYQALAEHLVPHAGTPLPNSTIPCVLQSIELDELLDDAVDPRDPAAIKNSFQPVFWPSNGGQQTQRTWDGGHSFRSEAAKTYWMSLSTSQVRSAIRLWPWITQRLVDQTVCAAVPLTQETASDFLETQASVLVQYGFGLRIQALMVWDNHLETNGFREDLTSLPGLTGNVVGIGTTTPLEYVIILGQGNDDSLVQREYPTTNVPGSLYPMTRWSQVGHGQRVHFDVCGLFGSTFARVVVNGNEAAPLLVQVFADGGLIDAHLVVPSSIPYGARCTIQGFVANGHVGPTIPLVHRDVFELYPGPLPSGQPGGLTAGGERHP